MSPSQIEHGMTHVCEKNGVLLGFYAFNIDEEGPEMVALFVEPNQIGSGIGHRLWKHSIEFAKTMGWNTFRIVADPYAADKFYYRVGCEKIGEVKSPVRSGRVLPLLRFDLNLV